MTSSLMYSILTISAKNTYDYGPNTIMFFRGSREGLPPAANLKINRMFIARLKKQKKKVKIRKITLLC